MPGSCCTDECASACSSSSNINCCGCSDNPNENCPSSEDEVADFLAKYEQDE